MECLLYFWEGGFWEGTSYLNEIEVIFWIFSYCLHVFVQNVMRFQLYCPIKQFLYFLSCAAIFFVRLLIAPHFLNLSVFAYKWIHIVLFLYVAWSMAMKHNHYSVKRRRRHLCLAPMTSCWADAALLPPAVSVWLNTVTHLFAHI